MSMAETLEEIQKDLKAIKNKMEIVTRLEERVLNHHETLGRFGNSIDGNTTDLTNIKIAIAGNRTSTIDIQALIKWGSALLSAFIIAAYLNHHTAEAAIINNDKVKVKTIDIIKKGKDKDD